MAATLTEPAVLAAAKDTLYPDLNSTANHYAVTETQFTQATWGGWTIPDDLQDRLAPYNTIRLAEGEPDLLGVGMPAPEVLNADAATTPVAVIEAKGHNSDPTAADVTRGINQAHSHLSEVNLGYVAAPAPSITGTARALARNLNIGLIGVKTTDDATLIEPPRITGAGDFSTGIDAIRFQAGTHHLTHGSFPVNHPKNYLGYPLCLAAAGDTKDVYTSNVINDFRGGRRGAILLGLVDDRADGEYLTHLGAEVIRFARQQHGSIENALTQFNAWKRKQTPFTELAPRWAQLARSITMQYEPTQLIIDTLEHLHNEGVEKATLPEVAEQACRLNRPLAIEVFFTQGRREDVLDPDGDIDEQALHDPTIYKSGIHFQYKYQLRHVGLLTTGGTDDKSEVLNEEWQLEQSIRANLQYL